MRKMKILTTSARAKTIGNPKLHTMSPIVKKIDNSKHGVVPDNELCMDRLATNVGITDNT